MIPISESNLSIFVHALIQHVGFNMWENSYRRRMEDGDGWWRWMEDGDGWRMEAEAMAQQRRRWSVRPPLLSMLAEWSHALLFGRKCGHSLPKQSPRAPESWKKLKAEQLGLSGRPNHRTIPNLCACWLQLRQRSSHVYCNLWEICCNTPHVQRRSETLPLGCDASQTELPERYQPESANALGSFQNGVAIKFRKISHLCPYDLPVHRWILLQWLLRAPSLPGISFQNAPWKGQQRRSFLLGGRKPFARWVGAHLSSSAAGMDKRLRGWSLRHQESTESEWSPVSRLPWTMVDTCGYQIWQSESKNDKNAYCRINYTTCWRWLKPISAMLISHVATPLKSNFGASQRGKVTEPKIQLALAWISWSVAIF